MKFEYGNVKISGIHLVVPENEVIFEDEIDLYDFSEAQSRKLKSVMGFDRRRVVTENTTSSDLVVKGFSDLVSRGDLELDSVDALLVVTQTPDYLMPGTSSIIHGSLPFRSNMLCLDINQGCAGFVVGLNVASSLLQQAEVNRVALVNVDVLSRLVASADRNSRPIIGDAAAITLVDSIDSARSAGKISGRIYTDGAGWEALKIPAGGMRLRPSSETCKLKQDSAGNWRSEDNLVMKGDQVFDFVMKRIPSLISELIEDSGQSKEDLDLFVFHQPNSFILKKLANKLGVSLSKVPHDLVSKFGNSSGVTIPAVLATECDKNFFASKKNLMLAGFGVGLTWGGATISIHDLEFLSVCDF